MKTLKIMTIADLHDMAREFWERRGGRLVDLRFVITTGDHPARGGTGDRVHARAEVEDRVGDDCIRWAIASAAIAAEQLDQAAAAEAGEDRRRVLVLCADSMRARVATLKDLLSAGVAPVGEEPR